MKDWNIIRRKKLEEKAFFIPGIRDLSPFEKQKTSFFLSYWLIQIFYATLFIRLQRPLGHWNEFITKVQTVDSWPSHWIWWGNQSTNLTTLVVIGMLSSLISCLRPYYLLPRLLSAASTFIFFSYAVAYRGYNYHSAYGYVLLSLVFLFLPNQRKSRSQILFRQQTLVCMWFAAASIVSVYFLIGVGNLYAGLTQLLNGEVSIFSPKSPAYFVLYEIQNYSKHTLLGDLVVNYSGFFWLGIFVVLLKKLSSPMSLIFCRFLPVYGVGFLLFHGFNAFAFGLPFAELALQVFLFLVINPIQFSQSIVLRSFKRVQ